MNKLILCFILTIFIIYNSQNKLIGGITNFNTTHEDWLAYQKNKKKTNLKFYLMIGAGVLIMIISVYLYKIMYNFQKDLETAEKYFPKELKKVKEDALLERDGRDVARDLEDILEKNYPDNDEGPDFDPEEDNNLRKLSSQIDELRKLSSQIDELRNLSSQIDEYTNTEQEHIHSM